MSIVSLKEAGLRVRDLLGAGVLGGILVVVVAANYRDAAARVIGKPQNLHIAVAAARRLDSGSSLLMQDLVIRVRRIRSTEESFDEPKRLVGRQLAVNVHRGDVIEEKDLVPLAASRKRSGTFFVTIDA